MSSNRTQTNLDQFTKKSLPIHKGQQLLAEAYSSAIYALVLVEDVDIDAGEEVMLTFDSDWEMPVLIIEQHRLNVMKCFSEIVRQDAEFIPNDLRQMLEYLNNYHEETIDADSMVTLLLYQEDISAVLSELFPESSD